MIKLTKFNIFTSLMVIAVFALVMRVVEISNLVIPSSVAESSKADEDVVKKINSKKTPVDTADLENKKAFKNALGDKSKFGMIEYTPVEIEVLNSLSKRRDLLEKREKEIAKQEALLKAGEKEIDRKVAELLKIKSELKNLLEDQSNMQKGRIQSLVKIYSGMKPKQAARIFDTLNMDILLAVIGKMSERKTSPILANMNPDKARKVTIRLAGQHKLPELTENKKEK